MKRLFLLSIIFSSALWSHAQMQYKNEVSLGYFSAGEFFDDTPFQVSSFNKGRHISLNYTRLFGQNMSIGLTYVRSGFQYVPIEVGRYDLEPYTTEFRAQRIFTANIGLNISKWSLSIRPKAGIRYNQRSWKVIHLYGGWHSHGWYESFGLIDRYGWLGASVGVSIAHPIFWRIFGEFDSEYARMFTRADRNQHLLSYRIGFRF
ncbi:MAG: hypothetical protein Q7T20_07250 [Saprospiraceae bacterium]|nr:hypothetical protein [Saprospiraceae bacterium]